MKPFSLDFTQYFDISTNIYIGWLGPFFWANISKIYCDYQ